MITPRYMAATAVSLLVCSPSQILPRMFCIPCFPFVLLYFVYKWKVQLTYDLIRIRVSSCLAVTTYQIYALLSALVMSEKKVTTISRNLLLTIRTRLRFCGYLLTFIRISYGKYKSLCASQNKYHTKKWFNDYGNWKGIPFSKHSYWISGCSYYVIFCPFLYHVDNTEYEMGNAEWSATFRVKFGFCKW